VESDPRDVVARYWDALWRRCDLSAVEVLFTQPYVRHSAAGTRTLTHAQLADELRSAWRLLHDPETTVDDQVADGDRVWTRATTTGVTLDTGEPAVLTWLVVHRVAGGRLAESWSATIPGTDWR
jgi:ketosteroid isomerase-like protein